MKKLMTIFGAVLIASFVLPSCGGSDDPKENGAEAGELECECKEINKEIKENDKQIGRLAWTGDKADQESREQIAELEMANIELGRELGELYEDIADLRNKQWTATEKEDDKKHWLEDYNEAKKDYVDDNCKDK